MYHKRYFHEVWYGGLRESLILLMLCLWTAHTRINLFEYKYVRPNHDLSEDEILHNIYEHDQT